MTGIQFLLTLILAVLVAEIITGRHKGVYTRDDILIIASTFLLNRALMGPFSSVAVAWVFTMAIPGLHGALADAPVIPSLIVLLLIGDFIFYWVHRIAHSPAKHPYLSKMHYTHHSARFLNLSVMMRYNFFWPMLQPYTWVTGIAFYLGMDLAATLFFVGMLAWNAMTHTNFRWDDALIEHVSFGRKIVETIELVFVTPRLHHTHHGFGQDGKAYRNFCTMLSIYDRYFGTLYIPNGRPASYGIMGTKLTWMEQLFFPLYQVKRDNSGSFAKSAPSKP